VKSVLVTGGCGFIGRHLLKQLLHLSQQQERHLKIIVIDDLSNIRTRSTFGSYSLGQHTKDSGFSFYNEDIRNKGAILRILKHKKIDTCIHLAAKINVPHSIKNPTETIDVNVGGMLNVLEACSRYKVRNFIFASSAAVYGRPLKLPIAETQLLNPLSPYGAAKVAGEALVSSYQSLGKIEKVLSLRFFNVYGPGQSSGYSDVITKFANRLSKQLPPIIYGDGKQTRDFISVNDVINCIISAIETMQNDRTVKRPNTSRLPSLSCSNVNVGTGTPTTINELAEKMIRIYGLDIAPVYSPDKNEGDIEDSYADPKKAREFLNFKAKDKLEYGLRKMLKSSS
jgi:UDP-glucose 4-epimerase